MNPILEAFIECCHPIIAAFQRPPRRNPAQNNRDAAIQAIRREVIAPQQNRDNNPLQPHAPLVIGNPFEPLAWDFPPNGPQHNPVIPPLPAAPEPPPHAEMDNASQAQMQHGEQKQAEAKNNPAVGPAQNPLAAPLPPASNPPPVVVDNAILAQIQKDEQEKAEAKLEQEEDDQALANLILEKEKINNDQTAPQASENDFLARYVDSLERCKNKLCLEDASKDFSVRKAIESWDPEIYEVLLNLACHHLLITSLEKNEGISLFGGKGPEITLYQQNPGSELLNQFYLIKTNFSQLSEVERKQLKDKLSSLDKTLLKTKKSQDLFNLIGDFTHKQVEPQLSHSKDEVLRNRFASLFQ